MPFYVFVFTYLFCAKFSFLVNFPFLVAMIWEKNAVKPNPKAYKMVRGTWNVCQ